ncbi:MULTISPECIES: hypothetical protein [unclassified Pseudomonas]|uniref:hypothetical protein n=1 Tax=unclassified Pseudomonas TaxID=196821 RepID=UPI0025FD4E4E|nr:MULTISPECIES: hypothetical protein [unclassified Pseudomonas]
MADANELLGNLAKACRIREEARKLVDSLELQLENAQRAHNQSDSAVRSAEIDILKEAIERGAQNVDANEGKSTSLMAITVDLPQANDPAIKGLAQIIVVDVCEAIVERLRNIPEGAGREAPI